MLTPNPTERFSISFIKKSRQPETAFRDALARFAAADDRWASVLDLAAAGLSETGREAFGEALAALEAGRAPRLLPFMMEPDDQDAIGQEAARMDHVLLTSLGLLIPGKLGFGNPEIAAVQGLISAVHRMLRIAKARP